MSHSQGYLLWKQVGGGSGHPYIFIPFIDPGSIIYPSTSANSKLVIIATPTPTPALEHVSTVPREDYLFIK